MPEKKFTDSAFGPYVIYGAAGIQLAISVIAGLAFGSYLDKRLGSLPWLTAIGVILGFVGGLVNLVRILGSFHGERKR